MKGQKNYLQRMEGIGLPLLGAGAMLAAMLGGMVNGSVKYNADAKKSAYEVVQKALQVGEPLDREGRNVVATINSNGLTKCVYVERVPGTEEPYNVRIATFHDYMDIVDKGARGHVSEAKIGDKKFINGTSRDFWAVFSDYGYSWNLAQLNYALARNQIINGEKDTLFENECKMKGLAFLANQKDKR